MLPCVHDSTMYKSHDRKQLKCPPTDYWIKK